MISPLGIIVCADDALARAGLAALLGALPELDIVAQETSDSLMSDYGQVDADSASAIVWDVGWNGIGEAVELAALDHPVVALVGDLEQAGEAWRAGARALLWRNATEEDILAAIRAVCAGLLVLAPGFAAALTEQVREDVADGADELTTRETEVLSLVALGLTNKAIGLRLSISEHTVKFHLNSILGKLGAQSRTEAVVVATRRGLISL